MEKKYVKLLICMLVFSLIGSSTLLSVQGENNYSGRDTVQIQAPIIQKQNPILDGSDVFYVSNLHDDDNLCFFNPTTPDNFTVIGPSSSTEFLSAGDFVEDTWFASEYSATSVSNLWSIDHLTGAMTLIGNTGIGLNGLAYDDVTETLYGCDNTNLYSIDMLTAASTLIGAMGNSGTMIGIAFDSSGNLYGEDLNDDNLYSINPTNGAATIIGSIGIDLNYAQDMAIDKDTDICYITGYKGSTNGGGALYTVNTSTGLSTFIGDFPIGTMGCPSEVSAFAIPYSLGPFPQNVMISSLDAGWNTVSLPFNYTVPKANFTVNYAGMNYSWADAVTNGYVGDYVFGWNRATQSYGFADVFEPGEAYWVFMYEPCEFWMNNITIYLNDIETSFSDGWNLMGLHTLDVVPKANLTIGYGGTDYTWADAVTNSYVSDYVFGWNRATQSYEFADIVYPGFGYWMYSSIDCVAKYLI